MGDVPLDTGGVKTFFVVPDLSLFSEDNLKYFCLKGFECYFLDDDPYCALVAKIEILFSLFKELILFINIDRRIQGVDWPAFIGSLQRKYGERAIIGVMFCKRTTQDEMRRLERLYLYEIGIIAGCIPLEYQKAKNQNIFLNVLIANQAQGQRKHLRALCDSGYRMNMLYDGHLHMGTLRDISVSHFSCVFADGDPELPLHEKVYDLQMSLHGVLFKVDAVFCLKRVIDEDGIHVFVFRTSDDREGLNPDLAIRVNAVIFNSLQSCMGYRLKAEFDRERLRVQRERLARQLPVATEEDAAAMVKAVKNLDVAQLLKVIG